MFTQTVVVVVVVVVFRLLSYYWERDLWYLIRLFTRSFIAKKLACWEIFLKAWCCLSDWKFLRKKILLLIPLFYLRHFTNKESEPVRPCQSMKNGMWIRLKIDSPRGTESEKQQSPKADRSSPCDIFLSRCMNVVTSYPSYYSQRIWARQADSGASCNLTYLVCWTWILSEICLQSYIWRIKDICIHHPRLCIQAWPYRMLNICSGSCLLLLLSTLHSLIPPAFSDKTWPFPLNVSQLMLHVSLFYGLSSCQPSSRGADRL